MNDPQIDLESYTKYIAKLQREQREVEVKAASLKLCAIAGWVLAITVWVLR